jgi:hypothetical protein
MALEKGAGPVVWIDDPAETRIGMRQDAGLFSHEATAEQRQQLLAQHELDLLIDVGFVAVAAWPGMRWNAATSLSPARSTHVMTRDNKSGKRSFPSTARLCTPVRSGRMRPLGRARFLSRASAVRERLRIPVG